MQTTDFDDIPAIAMNWHATGQGAVLATVIETWGSAPRPVGSQLAISGSGEIAGSVAIGVIPDLGMGEARGAPDLDIAPELRVSHFAVRVKEGRIRFETRHQWPASLPAISLRRSQPEKLSIATTIRMISTM